MQLRVRLLDQRQPQFIPRRVRECQSAGVLLDREVVVDGDRAPGAGLAEAHLVGADVVQLLGQEEVLDQLRPFGQDAQGGDEPAVAQLALLDVARAHLDAPLAVERQDAPGLAALLRGVPTALPRERAPLRLGDDTTRRWVPLRHESMGEGLGAARAVDGAIARAEAVVRELVARGAADRHDLLPLSGSFALAGWIEHGV